MVDTKIVRAGTPWMTILQLIFIVLKVTGTVSWTWGVVLIPLWICLGLAGLITLIAIIGIIAAAYILANE